MTRDNARDITVAMRKAYAGFTLIELMIVLVISSILLTMAVPSFSEVMRNNRLTTATNNLVTSFNLARSEAIKRRSNITVCASSDQAGCTGGSWADGWIVINAATNEVIRIFEPMKGNPTVTSAVSSVAYTQEGFLNGGAPVSIGLCFESGKPGRQIDIAATGRSSNVTPYPTC